jgi:regulator of replication initiation timing
MKREELDAVLDEVGQVVDRLRAELRELRLELTAARTENTAQRAELAILRADLTGLIDRAVERVIAAKTPADLVDAIQSAGIAVPIMRGYWHPELTYLPGDRVVKDGEWSATRLNMGIDPTIPDAEQPQPAWLKVGGKNGTRATVRFEGGKLYQSDREVLDLESEVDRRVDQRFEHAVREYAAKQA